MDRIGIYEYSVLEQKQKTELVYLKGNLITSIEFEGEKKLLYFIYDFFVEITFNDQGVNSVTQFKKGESLNKYLDKIELKDFEN
jgi:hypothetical protein